jgi:hypothetical protein
MCVSCRQLLPLFLLCMKLLGIISVGFDITDQLLIRFSAFVSYWEYNETVHQIFVDFKKAYDSVRREVLYNILIEFGVPMEPVRLIKMFLNETYSKVRMGNWFLMMPSIATMFQYFNSFLFLFFLTTCFGPYRPSSREIQNWMF